MGRLLQPRCAVALLLVLAVAWSGPGATAAGGEKELMLLDGVNPLNPFPAGLDALPSMPYKYKYEEPPVPANAYRGVYVSVLSDPLPD